MRRLLIGAILLALAGPVMAQEPPPVPDQPLAVAAQEARAQALFNEIRCVVCQHESIADSPAGVASDMRRWVREEIAEGRTDAEVRAGLVERYGDYVLFTPPFRPGTLILWGLPFLLVVGAGGVLVWRTRRGRAEPGPDARLSKTEEAAVADLLKAARLGPEEDSSSPHETH